jgi:hypothetical protein
MCTVTTDTLPDIQEEPAPQDTPFRLKAVPLVVAIFLAFALPFVAYLLGVFSAIWLHTPTPHGPALPWYYVQHGFQLVVALIVILILRRFVPADYGLHAPRGKSYIGWAIVWGAFFGVLMTAVDYAPQLLAHTKPVLGYTLTPINIGGWMVFEGIYVGPTEEIPFRALLVTWLAATMPGKVHLGRFNMNGAGIVVAVIFALLHAANFDVRIWPIALGQQIYAFLLGVLYAYWLEKSKSVVAPIIGHNVSDGVEYAILFAWVGLAPG